MSTLVTLQFNDAIPASRAWHRWAAFAVVSLVVHSLLLLGYDKSLPALPAEALGSRVISISLAPLREQPMQATQQATQPEGPEPARRRQISDNSIMATAPTLLSTASPQPLHEPLSDIVTQATTLQPVATRNSDTETRPQNLTQQSSTAEQTAESLLQQEQEQRNYLLGKVHSLLTQHFRYPPRARQRGWEGEVLLGFHVDEKGRVGNVRLARSSGYSLLDQSALAALTEIRGIPLSNEHPFPSMELQLPVLYQLREG